MNFLGLKLKGKIITILAILLIPTTVVGLIYAYETVYRLQVFTALSGLMNFVDSKQQGVIRFIGSSEKLAKQLAILVENASPEVVAKQFKAVTETDIFRPDDHQFKSEIEDGFREIATWEAYHRIDFVRQGLIEISSDPSSVGTKVELLPDIRHGYSDVYLDKDVPVFTVGAEASGGMVYIHVNAGMLTIITNGEIGNLEGDMGAYYLAGVGKTFDYYIVNRDNIMITQSRVFPNSLLKKTGSVFPWKMTLQDPSLDINCLPDGSYITNAGHFTGCREAMGFYTGPSGKEMLGASMPFYDSEWTIVVEQEAKELLGPLYQLRDRLSLGVVAVLILTLSAGYLFVSNVTLPLTNIIGDMIRLIGGDTNIKIHAQSRKDEIGDLSKVVGVFKETIIKNFLAEGELRKLSRAVEQSPYMVFITNLNGHIEYINPKFIEMTGYSHEEVIGQNPRFLKSETTSSELHSQLWKTIKSGEVWKGELEDKRKDGSTFWASMTISPVRNPHNEITNFIATHEDISKRRESDERIKSAMVKAEVANRAKSDLMANMSHELRTPLNAIIGFSESMKEETFGSVGSDKNREYLDDIHHSGQHLLELINDILDASAIEADALNLYEENFTVADVIDESTRIINQEAERNKIALKSHVDRESPVIYADRRRFRQIMINLLSNAVKFTPKGGAITIDSLLNDDGSFSIYVSDTGYGMSEEEISIAISAFGQVDSGHNRKHEGTGLGLPLTKGLMELHGGTLEIESLEGYGTMVSVTFPKERIV